MSTQQSIVFLDVDVQLFKTCFVEGIKEDHVKSKAWTSFQWVVLDSSSPTCVSDFADSIKSPNDVCSVIFQDFDLPPALLDQLKQFYESGGSVVFFGIEGVFTDAETLSQHFGLPDPWRFSGYSKYEYELTYTAADHLGWEVKEQQYTKANLLRVPVQDRWMVAKPQPLHQYVEEAAGSLKGESPDDEWMHDAKEAEEEYISYCKQQYSYCPLAVHLNKNGGRLAFLGFVNGDGNIPLIVRGLVTKNPIPSYSVMGGWR